MESPGRAGDTRDPSRVVFLCMFAGQSALLVLSPMLPTVADHFGVSTATAGQLRSVSGLTAGLSALAVGALASRIGVRALLRTGLALLGAGSLLSAAAPAFVVLAVAQLPIGAGLALVLGGALAAADEWAPPGQRARVLSWALLGPPASWVIGMPVTGTLTEVSWRLPWIAVPLAAAVAAGVLLHGRPRDTVQHDPEHAWSRAWHRPGVAAWAVGELSASAAWTGTLVYAGALFIETYGMSAASVGLLLGGAALAYMPGNFTARRYVDAWARPMLIGVALASAVVVAALGVVRPGIGVSFGIFAVLACLSGARTIAGSTLGLDAAPQEKVVVMSLRAAALQFGYLIGAAAGGAALAAGGYRAVGTVFAGLYVTAAVALLLARPESRAPQSPATLGWSHDQHHSPPA
jgi:MFS transporter, DHA1 family, inner membrane transport protein